MSENADIDVRPLDGGESATHGLTQDQFAREELANFLTHCLGFLLASVGAFVLISSLKEDATRLLTLGCWVYALGLIGVYAASTLSHLFHDPARRHFFRCWDQGVIFLFIAGSFTPFAIVYLHGQLWMGLLGLMWVGAFVGFCSKVFWGYRVESTVVTHYLALGWLPVAATQPILRALSMDGIAWCIAGGLWYTVGTIFLALDTRVRYFHAVWHLFVIAGSYCHFVLINDYVILHRM
jgi:hemolysin III